MRCYCCDKALTEAEVQYIPETKQFECCSICLEIAMDAAYSDGFVPVDDDVTPFGDGSVETLEPGVFQTAFEFYSTPSGMENSDD